MTAQKDSDDMPLTRRECDRCPLNKEINSVKSTIDGVKEWVGKIDNRLWAIVVGLVMLLFTGFGNLALHFFDRPDANAIAAQIVNAMKQPH
jgi:hypothetical protein